MSDSVIIAAGATNAAGYTLKALDLAFRAGAAGFERSRRFRDRWSGEPVVTATVDGIEVLTAKERMLTLARMAIDDCLSGVKVHSQVKIALLLGLSEERPGFEEAAQTELVKQIAGGYERIDTHQCMVTSGGSAGGFVLLELAEQLLREGKVDACLAGGVDCFTDIATIDWIEQFGRLQNSQNPNGLIPGEGAAFVLVANRQRATSLQLPVLCELLAHYVAEEPDPWFTGRPTMAKGLTEALQGVFDKTGVQADPVYCDMNGESWRADEWGYAYLRSAENIGNPLRMLHPSGSIGDVGAAAGFTCAALAAHSLFRGDAERGSILTWAASGASAFRGAVLLRSVS